jgi:nucleoside-diphosphate-sugar epimerase
VLWGAGGIYGVVPKDRLPITEQTPPRPPNNYLQSKWAQEVLVQEYFHHRQFPYTTVRPTGVYGPRAAYGVGKLIRDLAKMKTIRCPKNFTGRVPLIHAQDVCRAALYLAQRPDTLGEAYNLADDTPWTNIHFMEILAELLHKPFKLAPAIPVPLLKKLLLFAASVEKLLSKITHKPLKLEKDSLFVLGEDFWYSNEKLKRTGFQYAYPEGRKGLAETISWYRENGLI